MVEKHLIENSWFLASTNALTTKSSVWVLASDMEQLLCRRPEGPESMSLAHIPLFVPLFSIHAPVHPRPLLQTIYVVTFTVNCTCTVPLRPRSLLLAFAISSFFHFIAVRIITRKNPVVGYRDAHPCSFAVEILARPRIAGNVSVPPMAIWRRRSSRDKATCSGKKRKPYQHANTPQQPHCYISSSHWWVTAVDSPGKGCVNRRSMRPKISSRLRPVED